MALLCDECGHEMTIDENGISYHRDAEGRIDWDQDRDHVAYTTQSGIAVDWDQAAALDSTANRLELGLGTE